MRPVRVEVEGFTAFRRPTTVDFEGVDLFALCGRTGSGKTSVLDAIVFALYGVLPRLADARKVEPAISQGAPEARVSLEFTLGGERYTAMRVVRRTKSGATTPEARLERGGESLASGADEVTAAVVDLLGLTYDHFTKCVVLPQGEFARFLHDKPRDRQALLVSLLDLGLYGRMAQLASERRTAAAAEAEALAGQAASLAVTDDDLTATRERIDALRSLRADVEEAMPALAACAAAIAEAEERRRAAAADLGVLESLRSPPGLRDLDTRLREAEEALATTSAAAEVADEALDRADAVLAGLPERGALEAELERFDRRATVTKLVGKGRAALAEAVAATSAAEAEANGAAVALAQAESAVEAARAAHRAHAARADLVPGQPCPVCLQDVSEVPDLAAPPVVTEAEAMLAAARRAAEHAASAAGAARTEQARVETKLAALEEELAELDRRLASGGPDGVRAQLAAVDEARSARAAAASGATTARAARNAAAGVVEDVRAAEKEVARAFDAARDTVAALGPPARQGRSLEEDWEALQAWARAEAAARSAAAAAAADAVRAGQGERAALADSILERCAAGGLAVSDPERARDFVVDALAGAEARASQLEEQRGAAARIREQATAAEERRDVAKDLALHLNASHFERWVLDAAVSDLADGATELLRSLSSGRYALRHDKAAGFLVVDHHNASEERNARTLSGGETFLASLALALALADRISALAAGSGARGRLEAIFLDEGFGTLDAETLDTVASAIEELGAAGRMVGIVSHVPELAERVPVRFDVTRLGNDSEIVRVDR